MARFLSTIIILMLISLNIFSQTNYQVSGTSFLEDVLPSSEGHDGIAIQFIDLILQDTAAIAYTDTEGNFSIDVPPGFYLVKWEKDGYIPYELGNYALSTDTTLSSITLLPGQIVDVCGEVYGTWSSGAVYHVTCDVSVPFGATLTIEPGVTVKFFQGTGMDCYGTLNVLGADSSKVLFTSKEPTPLPGDWDNVELYGYQNIIQHLNYEYASDGFVGNNAVGSTFDHLYMVGNLSLTANGIYMGNSANMTYTNNTIAVAGEYGIYSENSANSIVQNNSIDGSYSQAAIRMDNCSYCDFSDNIITNHPYRGIWADNAFTTTINGNDLDVEYQGIYARDGSFLTISNNTISDFDESGIDFNSSENSTIEYNYIKNTSHDGGWKVGIYNSSDSQNAIISYNYVEVYGGGNGAVGIQSHDSQITFDSWTSNYLNTFDLL